MALMTALVGLPAGAVPASASTLPSTLTLVGHGWGHGRGMGQYGALGYAQGGWSYQQILAHYYGGTVLKAIAPRTVNVSLSELYGAGSITVSAPSGSQLYLDSKAVASPKTIARASVDHTFYAKNGSTPTDVVVNGPWSTGSQRRFAGSVILKANSSAPRVWNTVSLEQYVDGVVPRESPASWPVPALESQAVAARSYALAVLAYSQTICDTTSCQVYGGDPAQYGSLYNGHTAVVDTAGQVLECQAAACGTAGQFAFTEFSSSTGGYTAGGRFPSVVDAGDATSSNPNHTWSASVPTGVVQQAFPSVGTLQSIAITKRNGLGDMGGRVTQMVLVGSAARDTITGDQFAWAVGLNSDWFTITNTGASSGQTNGYWVVASNGGVYPFGAAPNYGSMVGHSLNAPVIGMAPTGDGAGYWLVARDGGIFSFGDARFYGSTGSMRLNRPVIGMASTRDGHGYWLVASDGGIFSFGDAVFYGSTGNMKLNQPIVALTPTPTGHGYWLVASDGGIFSFGDAHYYGSTGSMRLAQPIVGMVPTSDGRGYWLVGRDGGIFSFGDARFVGSLPGKGVTDTIVSVASTADAGGYVMVSAGGRAYVFGDAQYFGDPASTANGWSGIAVGIFTHKG